MSTAKPVILHVRGSDFFGSPERLIAGQMKHLTGYQSLCASFVKPGRGNKFLDAMKSEGLHAVEIEDNHLFDWNIPSRIREIVQENSVDLLVTHEYKSSIYGYLANRKIGVPQIAYFHGQTDEDAKVRLYYFLERRVLPGLARVVTVSQSTADRLSSSGVPRDNIRVVHNAIDIPPDLNAPVRKTHDPLVIGVVGRLSHEKGVHVLLEALTHMKSAARPFEVRIYGTGPDEKKLRRSANDLKLNDLVSFEGFCDNLDAVYPEFDFLVIPSLSEGHPLVILEAWRYGIGIVAARAGGVPEVITDGESGLLCNTNDPEGLANSIRKALDNPELMNKYGQAGFELLKTRFNFEKQAERLDSIYSEVLAKHRVN